MRNPVFQCYWHGCDAEYCAILKDKKCVGGADRKELWEFTYAKRKALAENLGLTLVPFHECCEKESLVAMDFELKYFPKPWKNHRLCPRRAVKPGLVENYALLFDTNFEPGKYNVYCVDYSDFYPQIARESTFGYGPVR